MVCAASWVNFFIVQSNGQGVGISLAINRKVPAVNEFNAWRKDLGAGDLGDRGAPSDVLGDGGAASNGPSRGDAGT